MKKNVNVPDILRKIVRLRVLIMMKLTVFFVCLSVFSGIAAGTYSQSAKISLDLRQTTIKDALKEIENTSNFYFLYNNDLIDVDKIVSIKVNNKGIEEVLDHLFEGESVKYMVMDRQVIISPEESEFKNVGQQSTVTGRVTDSSEESLPGVTVAIKGTNKGTITDLDGNYSIEASGNDVLVFSFIGMQTQEIAISNRSEINVEMRSDIVGLDEVIVIGYGTAKRQDFTGSVSSVNMETSPVSLAPNLNALESLKGNISGLNIGATNVAGGEPSMLIRGTNSISGDNNPLIILDGVIYLGSLNDINPNDIASVDVLKDAVSASVYGSRSANGVIAITTKKGKSDKPIITFNTSAGIQTWQNEPVMMKGEEWIKVVNDRNQYNEGATDWMKAGELANLAAGSERVWLDDVTRLGVVQDYQVAISGAANSLNYYVSSSYSNNKGIVVGDDFERISLLGKINASVTDWLDVGIDASFSKRDYSGFAANIASAQTMSPYGVMYRDDQGNLEKYPYTQSSVNPLWGVDDGTTDNMDIRHNYRLNTYTSIDIPWIKGLNFRMNFQINSYQNESGSFYYEDYYIAEGEGIDRYSPATVQGFLAKANGNLNTNSTYSYVWDNILSYKKSFGKHTLEGTLVATRDFSRYRIKYVTGSDFAANGNTALGMWGLHKSTVQKVDLYVNSSASGNQIGGVEKTNIGYLGRLNYNYDGKYYITGSYRRDGASVFGANNKWGNFAAFGLAWRISDEDFLKGSQTLNDMKLKLSWGQNGNQGAGPYSTLSQVANGSSGGYRYGFGDDPGTIYYGLVQSTIGNYDLGWESTTSWNGGLESSWLDDRIAVNMDLYFSKTTDQIFERAIPVMTGFKTILTSLGQVNNAGVELTIRTSNIRKGDLYWNSELTFWRNRNKIVHLDGSDIDGDGVEDDDIANGWFIGEPIGTIYGYQQDGIVQEDDTEYIALTSASPGAPKYKDIDEVAGITSDDRTILGYEQPNFSMNLSNSVGYKNFELYVMLSGIFGGNNYYMKANQAAYMTSGTGRFNDNMTSKPYWTSDNPGNTYPSATFSGDGRFLGLQSRGFIRLQDVSLSYSFDKQWLKMTGIKSMRLFVSAKNVATFTDWFGGDPETGTPVRENTFPVPSTYSIGANISF
jgi:TonB-linked SusC/RagA family outer membrane protein